MKKSDNLTATERLANISYKADILSSLVASVEDRKKFILNDYGFTGEYKQAYDYSNHCPAVDENGEPVMTEVYDYIPKENLTDADKIHLAICDEIMQGLVDLI